MLTSEKYVAFSDYLSMLLSSDAPRKTGLHFVDLRPVVISRTGPRTISVTNAGVGQLRGLEPSVTFMDLESIRATMGQASAPDTKKDITSPLPPSSPETTSSPSSDSEELP